MKKKINVVVLSQYFPPDVSGGATRAFNYSKCLEQQNYNVTVITAHPHQHGPVPKNYRNKLTKKEKMGNLDLIRVWVPSLLHSSIKNSAILNFSFCFTSLFPLFSIKSKPDVILAFEPNLFSIIPAYFYSKLRGGIVLRIVDDMWPELLYEQKILKSNFLRKFLTHLAKFSYNYSKHIIPLNSEVKEMIHELYEINNDKIDVISHGIDDTLFSFTEKKRQKVFTLMYSGSLVNSYDFDIILNAARKLKNKNIEFVIRGKGKLLSYLQEQKAKFQIDNLVINSDFVSIDQLSATLSKSDVFLVPMGKGHSLNTSLPTKILESQAIGRPIICCSSGAIGNYVQATKSGICVGEGDLDGFINAILKLESDEQLCQELGQNGRNSIEKNHKFEVIGKRLSSIIQKSLQIT